MQASANNPRSSSKYTAEPGGEIYMSAFRCLHKLTSSSERRPHSFNSDERTRGVWIPSALQHHHISSMFNSASDVPEQNFSRICEICKKWFSKNGARR